MGDIGAFVCVTMNMDAYAYIKSCMHMDPSGCICIYTNAFEFVTDTYSVSHVLYIHTYVYIHVYIYICICHVILSHNTQKSE